ncbi:MAG TPA: hypothetical protein DCQ56_04415 [Porphyromonadaceae bacterium]|nr:hypothetical protein [Porphyromonadaceae bacterium]
MNENYSMPPVPQPEPPREPWLLRNKPGAIGLGLQLLALPLLVILPEAAFLAGAAGFLLCIAGLFIKPRLLPTLGVLIGLAVSGVFLIVMLAAGQYRPPKPVEDEEVVIEMVDGDSSIDETTDTTRIEVEPVEVEPEEVETE